MAKKLFITGTGTDIGKTYVTGLIVKKLFEDGVRSAYFKAAASGNERKNGVLVPGDPIFVKRLSGIEQSTAQMCPYIYERALSPHLASQIEKNPVDFDKVKELFNVVCQDHDFVTMEGSGGIICPIRYDNQKIMLTDFIKEFDLPVLIIADAGLGTINNVVLTVEYMRAKNYKIAGLVLNNFESGNIMHEDNMKMCEELTGITVLCCVKKGDTELNMDVEKLKLMYE